MKTNISLYVLVLCLLTSGCSSKRNIDGEIFIDNNGNVQKLALVDMQILPEDQLIKHIKAKLSTADIEVKRIDGLIFKKENSVKTLKKNNEALSAIFKNYVDNTNKYQVQWSHIQVEKNRLISAQESGLDTSGAEYKLTMREIDIKERIINDKHNVAEEVQKIMTNSPIPIPKEIVMQLQSLTSSTEGAKKYMEIYVNSIKKLEEEIGALKEDQSGINTGLNGRFYYDKKIDNIPYTFTSNSDGKFQTTIDGTGRFALLASKEDRRWIIWLPSEKSKNTITLSNKNVASSGCNECIFNGKITPKSL